MEAKIMARLISKKRISALALAFVLMFAAATTAFATSPAPELPDTMIRDGRLYVKDASANSGTNSAIADSPATLLRSVNYQITGSDVSKYIDYSHGHGGDEYAYGWVQTTAPSFYARAELWNNGALDTTGQNSYNYAGEDIAYAGSYLSVGIVSSRYARIFYGWA
jgi:hypothetical protein